MHACSPHQHNPSTLSTHTALTLNMNFIFTLAATAILVVSSAASPVVEPLTVITPYVAPSIPHCCFL